MPPHPEGRHRRRDRRGDDTRQARARPARRSPSATASSSRASTSRCKHLRKSQQNPQGGRVQREAPIHAQQRDARRPDDRQADARRAAASWTGKPRARRAKSRGGRRRGGSDAGKATKAPKEARRRRPRKAKESRRWPACTRTYRTARCARACTKRARRQEPASRVPRLEKITINMGVGKARREQEAPRRTPSTTSRRSPARRPVVTKAQEGRSRSSSCARACRSACKVTLRGARDVGVPRPADLGRRSRASATSAACTDKLDGRGNYSMGLAEQTVFPEMDARQGRARRRA